MKTALNYLKELVAIDSKSGHEKAVVAYIAAMFQDLDCIKVGNSLLFKLRGVDGSKLLILNGHTDTVSAGEVEEWATPPLQLQIVGDKLYGLGASDMKGGLAVMMVLLDHFMETPPPCDIWWMFVEKEEIDGSGTKQILKAVENELDVYKIKGALLLEPTACESVGVGHRGNIFVEIEAHGLGGHGSQPYGQKPEAIDKAAHLIHGLANLKEQWSVEYAHPVLGLPSIQITGLHATGGSKNKIPTSAKIILDVRTTPLLQDNLKHELQKLEKSYDVEVHTSAAEALPYGWCDPQTVFYFTAKQAFNTLDFKVLPSASDQCFLSAAGVPSLVYGPGEPSVMHAPNEFIKSFNLRLAIHEIKKLVEAFGEYRLK